MSNSLQVGDLVLHIPSRDRGNMIKLGVVLRKRGESDVLTVMWSNYHVQRCRTRNIKRV
jgi:hypothetical protein